MNTMTRLSTGLLSPPSHIPLALQIIPSPQSHKEQVIALETMMQSLVLDKRHPLALEVVGADDRRSFIVRATTEAALDHAEGLLRSQYPQIAVRPLQKHEDPFRLEENEDVSAIELMETVARDIHKVSDGLPGSSKTDPLLGLLATLGKLPTHTRAILQVGLVPFKTNEFTSRLRAFFKGTWGAGLGSNITGSQLKNNNPQSLGSFGLVILANLLLLSVVYLFRALIPGWIWSIFGSFLHGDFLKVPANVETQLVIIAAVILIIEVLLFVGIETFYQSLVRVPDLRLVYRTRIRLYVIGPQQIGLPAQSRWHQLREERKQAERRQEILLRMVTAYRQFRTSSGTYFITRGVAASETRLLLSRDFEKIGHGWIRGLVSSHRLLSVEALAALWHLPPSRALPELEFVEYRRARTLLMPFEVARQSEGLATIGYSEHGSGGRRFPFGFLPQFFSHHTLISGKSGDGKSAFLAHLAREAMMRGGLVLIDPYGELCEQVLRIVPPSRAEDVVLIDLADGMASVGLNPLDVMLGRARDKAIIDLLKMLAHIWVSSWGAKMENAFEMSLRTLFEANKALVANDSQNGPGQQYTLLDVLPLLTNAKFCHTLLQDIQDDYLHRWWREYYEPLSLIQQRDVINPIIAKVAKFERIIARRIVGQSVSTLNITRMINERKIILLKLSRGVVGSDVASLIGATILGLIQMTLEEQGLQGKQKYENLPIILDEFQMLLGTDYRTLIELQQYGATFFLATQSLEYLQKLNPVLVPTVITNVKQIVAFHMAAQDAELVYKDLEVAPEDLLHLDLQTCYISLMAANQRQPTFSVKISSLPEGDSIDAESIRTRCRIRYTRNLKDVDEMLHEAMLRSLRLTPPGRDADPPQQKAAPPTRVFPIEEPRSRVISASLDVENYRERVPKNEKREERHQTDPLRPENEGVYSNAIPGAHFTDESGDGSILAEELEMLELNAQDENRDNEDNEDDEDDDEYSEYFEDKRRDGNRGSKRRL